MLVGEVAYQITIPSTKTSEEGNWCLTHTIQLTPAQAQEFVSFLGQHEKKPRKGYSSRSSRKKEDTETGVYADSKLGRGTEKRQYYGQD